MLIGLADCKSSSLKLIWAVQHNTDAFVACSAFVFSLVEIKTNNLDSFTTLAVDTTSLFSWYIPDTVEWDAVAEILNHAELYNWYCNL